MTNSSSKTVTALLMSARSMLRQARCPECQRNGMQGGSGCHWCIERAALMDAILEQPPNETKADAPLDKESAAQQEIARLDCIIAHFHGRDGSECCCVSCERRRSAVKTEVRDSEELDDGC